ncbi:MAG: hypothetical protein HY905_13310 [Deltaproteobacteria bacterium]|nr:hypothetical protein [Deltaproteobacteria bacterium]
MTRSARAPIWIVAALAVAGAWSCGPVRPTAGPAPQGGTPPATAAADVVQPPAQEDAGAAPPTATGDAGTTTPSAPADGGDEPTAPADAGSSAPSAPLPPGEGDRTTFEVEWDPLATVIDDVHAGVLLRADDAAHEYVFDERAVRAAGLELAPGRVLVLAGRALRRIAGAEASGGEIRVTTGPATLNEAIADGVVAWDRAITFSPDKVGAVAVADAKAVPEGDTIEFELDLEAYKVSIEVRLGGDRSDFKFTLVKELMGDAGAKFTIGGFLEAFRSRDRIEIRDNQVESFVHTLEGMRGEATLSVAVAASGEDFMTVELPVTIMSIPFLVGPIPVELKIRAQFVVNAIVPLDGSALASVKFTYDSELGFEYAGGEVHAGGHAGEVAIEEEQTPHTAASQAAGVNFGVGYPRVELDVFHETVVPWAQIAYLVGGTYTFFPACQSADALILGSAGYDLGFLGIVSLGGDSVEFFRQQRPLLRAGQCPEE